MIAKLVEVSSYCQSLAGPGVSVMAAVREFLNRYSTHPTNPSTGYYAAYTAPKNWDVIMTDFWKCIPAVSDPTQRYPELLCFDYTDLMAMILAQLGIACRSVRAIATAPSGTLGGYPQYLDHVFAEVWSGSKWSAQDGFYNCEYLLDQYTYASADDLCVSADLDLVTPRNKFTSGWSTNNLQGTLRAQDFYGAIEHRDDAGNSVVLLNGNRANFATLFRTSPTATPTPLRQLILGSVKHSAPTLIEIPS